MKAVGRRDGRTGSGRRRKAGRRDWYKGGLSTSKELLPLVELMLLVLLELLAVGGSRQGVVVGESEVTVPWAVAVTVVRLGGVVVAVRDGERVERVGRGTNVMKGGGASERGGLLRRGGGAQVGNEVGETFAVGGAINAEGVQVVGGELQKGLRGNKGGLEAWGETRETCAAQPSGDLGIGHGGNNIKKIGQGNKKQRQKTAKMN